MAYQRIDKPQGPLYHYTKKENLEKILSEQRIRKFIDKECWLCTSLEDTLRLMELTVMNEGGNYIDVNGHPRKYPKFEPEEYVILELSPRYQSGEWVMWHQEISKEARQEQVELAEEFSRLKKGYRGDLKFYPEPVIHEVAELLQQEQMEMKL